MAFGLVTWNFKDVISSSKLGQMVENLLVHDHRADGTQGAAMAKVHEQAVTVTVSGVAAGAQANVAGTWPSGFFSGTPKGWANVRSIAGGTAALTARVVPSSATAFTVYVYNTGTTTVSPGAVTVDVFGALLA